MFCCVNGCESFRPGRKPGSVRRHPSPANPGSAVWPPGFYFGMPWVQVSNLVSKQSVVFNMPVKGCKTQDNVTVQINLAVVFRCVSMLARPALTRKTDCR